MTAQIPLTGSIGPSGPFAILGFSLPVITGNADHVLTVAEYSSTSLKVTSDGASLAIRKVVAPLAPGMLFLVENLTSEGFAITFGGASGTAVTVPNGATVLVACPDGANYVAPGGGAGAATIVANAAALTALPASGLPNGTQAVVQTFGALFALSPAGPTVDGVTVIAASDGRVWQRSGSYIQEQAIAQAAWHIDAATGNDENSGLDFAHSLATAAELGRRWGTWSPVLNLATQILAGPGGILDPFTVTPLGSGSLIIEGTLNQVWTGLVAGLVAKARATNHAITMTAIAGMAQWQLVHNVTRNAYAVLYTVAGGTAIMGQSQTPVNPPALISATELDTWANGDTIVGYTQSTVDIRAGGFKGTGAATNGVFLYHVSVPNPLYCNEFLHILESDCQTSVVVSQKQTGIAATGNVFTTSGFRFRLATSELEYNTLQFTVAATAVSGCIIYCALGSFFFTNDTILAKNATSDRHTISGVITVGLYIDIEPVFTQGLLNVSGPTWGPGTISAGIGLGGGPSRVSINAAGGAVANILNAGGINFGGGLGYSWNVVPGTYNAGVAVTPASIDAAVAAGNIGLFYPPNQAAIV